MPRLAALTLLEMMVAITLLLVIMVGLLMMFNQTQKALHIVSQQTDVFEATRATIQMISRDLAELSDLDQSGVKNCYAFAPASPLPGSVLPVPAGNQAVAFGETFWLTRANDDWTGVGYFVDGTNSGIGTLYRYYAGNVRAARASNIINGFQLTNSHPVMDGVVHFSVSAVYVTNRSGFANDPAVAFDQAATFEFPLYYSEDAVVTNIFGPPMTNRVTTRIALPAFLDLEFGVLEPASLKQYQAIAAATPGTTVAQTFLINHVGKVHFFRERVPVRNFVNPYRANEAP